MPLPDEASPAHREPPPLHPERLTWMVLLGRWTEFARGAVALPTEGDGGRMRDSVADIITLQAVWFALQHLHELDRGEQALGLDRAGVLIERHESSLRRRWTSGLPGGVQELIDDARRQWEAVANGHRKTEAGQP
jgi:hypothetical protein